MSSAFKIRPVNSCDAQALAELHRGSFADHWPPSAFDALLTREHVKAFGGLVNEEGGLLGFVLIQVIADEAEILTICVMSKVRQHGLGGILLRSACRHAAMAGATRVFLEVGEKNSPARALYEACGFECVGRRGAYYRGSVLEEAADDALIMRKDLSATAL